ncbi:MAG: class I SAM-dependent methyltransferase [Lachnospiraceae bacterium]|nr:class I SAM-dependent methyltransferase [Lachnospiraceae bacterium]
MELSRRLYAVAELVDTCESMADIGTDHGYIPIFLVEQKRVDYAIAMDVRTGPLERAREHIKQHGLDEYIDLRLSDGAEKLAQREVQAVVIAGMGGKLMAKIIDSSREVFSGLSFFVLQPQSEHGYVRRFLEKQGFRIVKENMVKEDGKFYPMMKVTTGESRLGKACFYEYGKELLTEKNPVLEEYLQKENATYHKILQKLKAGESQSQRERIQEIEQCLCINQEALCYYKD